MGPRGLRAAMIVPRGFRGAMIVPMTVGGALIVPMTVGGAMIVPMTVRGAVDWSPLCRETSVSRTTDEEHSSLVSLETRFCLTKLE